jgi:hypothetical protein
MRRTEGITIAWMFGIILVLVGLHLSGRELWVAYATLGLMVLAVVVTVVRSIRGGKNGVARPMADSGTALNDLYLGTVHSGPRLVAPPLGKQIELVMDDGERREFLKALDDADPRSTENPPGGVKRRP